MNLFIPGLKKNYSPEDEIKRIRTSVKKSLGWKINNRKIFSITYKKNNGEGTIEVGTKNSLTKEIVIAIFQSQSFLVITPTRGLIAGSVPLLFGKEEVCSVTDFEEDFKK